MNLRVLSDLSSDAPHHETPTSKSKSNGKARGLGAMVAGSVSPIRSEPFTASDTGEDISEPQSTRSQPQAPESPGGVIRPVDLGNKTQAQVIGTVSRCRGHDACAGYPEPM